MTINKFFKTICNYNRLCDAFSSRYPKMDKFLLQCKNHPNATYFAL